jgi:hypothetical protein
VPEFTHALGDVVALAPTGTEVFPLHGLIIGHTVYIDGSIGYALSVSSDVGITRHTVSPHEVRAIAKED